MIAIQFERASEKDEENHFAGKYFAFERFLLFVVARDWVFSPLSCDYEVTRGVASFALALPSLMLPLSGRALARARALVDQSKPDRLSRDFIPSFAANPADSHN